MDDREAALTALRRVTAKRKRAIKRLDDEHVAAIVAAYDEAGASLADIANASGLSVETVRSRLTAKGVEMRAPSLHHGSGQQ